ncbi:hypothetical protein RMSM_01229 [Rhodopirellula maiorica SM1]|uniref:Uncharacterized protein n=1 Tax=Rhodopirellula maiorica SM1 TaxID=1265738 RepID=M5S6N7_9BACT|nr:hypothetical protein [Rhodopirellula maiorica]EMI21844.1 hypothetical protein RMSM_01229 [Rhodopirellula maiorica SM1]
MSDSDPSDVNQSASDTAASDTADSQVAEEQGPGWMPAILAATLLMGMAGFIFCGVSTWFLFQKRGELAVRTIRGSYIPDIEQSRLSPEQKQLLVKRLETFAESVERNEYENWQAAGVMQRLQRLPVLQWGELAAVESFVLSQDEGDTEESLKQISRLRRAAELDQATSFDFEDVLSPVHEPADNAQGRQLIQPLTATAVDEVIVRARLVADRSEVPDEKFTDISLDAIVQEQIDAGIAEGGF